tara:strand:+ start:2918 stop:3265 length:348 start_codon:yes stop_codon:yes gene_type:complete
MTEKVWRNLALQFDEHRMLALAHLRRALDSGLQNRQEIELFLQSPPRSGNEISAEADDLRAEVARLRAALGPIEKVNGVAHNYISCYDCRESSMIARAALAHGGADQLPSGGENK